METLANLESFVRSAELGSFSTAARRLSLTPAAVSRNVATLERNPVSGCFTAAHGSSL
jgi:DNA-binding transcriptional LysR family regulator